MAEKGVKRIAVFIDAENVSANYADTLFAEIEKRGRIDFCRAFGNFSTGLLSTWQEKIKERNFSIFQQDAVSNFKNAADIALVIGAMDLLHWKRADVFYVVSKDGDFTPLAKRIRKAGCSVIGVGPKGGSVAFQKACDEYLLLECEQQRGPKSAPIKKYIMPLQKVNKVLDRLTAQNGWFALTDVGRELTKIGVNYREYGHKTLPEALKTLSGFVIEKNGTSSRMRPK